MLGGAAARHQGNGARSLRVLQVFEDRASHPIRQHSRRAAGASVPDTPRFPCGDQYLWQVPGALVHGLHSLRYLQSWVSSSFESCLCIVGPPHFHLDSVLATVRIAMLPTATRFRGSVSLAETSRITPGRKRTILTVSRPRNWHFQRDALACRI